MKSILEIVAFYLEEEKELTHVTLCGDKTRPRLAISFADGHVETHELDEVSEEKLSNLSLGFEVLQNIEWQIRTEPLEVQVE